jgi:hypothetical protein
MKQKILTIFFGILFSNFAFSQTQIGSDIDGEAAHDYFGAAISMPDANTVAVGASYNDGNGTESGHVQIYELTSGTWTQKGGDIDGEAAFDNSGWSVSMPDAGTVAIGAFHNDGNGSNAGHVRIYEWDGISSWVQKGGDIDGEAAGDLSGCSVSMPDANTVAIGAVNNTGKYSQAGQVRIYTWNGSSWVQKGGDIDGEAAGDQSGYSVSMPNANTVAIGATFNDGNGADAGHVRIYNWNGSSWVQKGGDLDGEAAGDHFGYGTLSMPDVNTIAIGGNLNDGAGTDAGHACIYTWNGSSWVQKGADIDGEAAGDHSGGSVSMPDANTVAIGATGNAGNGTDAGHVRVYTWNGSSWVQQGNDIDGEAAGDLSGFVYMPDANTVGIGAWQNDTYLGWGSNSGHVRVYNVYGTCFVEAAQMGADIDGEAAINQSATSISMPDENTMAIGAPYNYDNGSYSGHVRIYDWDGISSWIQRGSDIDGEAASDQSGFSVSMPDMNTIAIGALYNSDNGGSSGHVRIYDWDGVSSWTQRGSDIDGESPNDQSGFSVSMPDANTVAIGAPHNSDNGSDAGHVRIYDWDGISSWIQRGSDIDGEAASDQSGFSVSMPDINTVAIGAPHNSDNGSDAGHVRIYDWDGISSWIQRGSDIDGEAASDQSGFSVSMPDINTVAIGAPYNSDNGISSGHVRIYDWDGISSWIQRGPVDIDGEAAYDQSGFSVSMADANTMAIGSPWHDSYRGQVSIYNWNGSAWVLKVENIDGEAAGDQSGWSVSMPNVYTVAIGGPYNDDNGGDAGHVRVYKTLKTCIDLTQTQIGTGINGEASGNTSGNSVSMPDAYTVAIGATWNNGIGSAAGHVRIYYWNGSAWAQKGIDIDGEAAYDHSGWSVSMPDANTVAIGAVTNSGSYTQSGQVRIYGWSGSAWIQKGIDIDGEAASDLSGWSVSMPDANTVAVGAPFNGSYAGHVRIYNWNGSSWAQKGVDINGEAIGDHSGYSVSMPDANTVAIGAPANSGAGHVRIYTWSGSAWVQKGVDIDGETFNDGSGWSVSMPDNNTVAIGAPQNSGNGTDAGHVRIYNWSGSAWAQRGADINGEAAGDLSGSSVSMPDANTVAIGAASNDGSGTDAGHVRIYKLLGGTWVQLVADIDGMAATDAFGTSVSMPDTNTVAIGAPNVGSGYVKVYSFSSSSYFDGFYKTTPTAIVENEENKPTVAYPNPTRGNLTVELGKTYDNVTLSVRNIIGQEVISKSFGSTDKLEFTLDQSSGIYFVEVKSAANVISKLKVIKE